MTGRSSRDRDALSEPRRAGETTWTAAIAVMAKEPIPGRVKTRLCPPYDHRQAARLAAAALMDTLDAVAATRTATRRVLVLDGDARTWQQPGFDSLAQRGDGLDERLGHALTDVAALTGVPVLLVGMDTPQLTPELLDRALGSLRTSDAVLGLATDGGFWAVGLQRPHTEHFVGVPMSRADTGRLQLERLREYGLRTTLLDELTDVDDASTAALVAAQSPTTRFARLVGELSVATPAQPTPAGARP